MFMATTRVDVLRAATTANDYGDDVDGDGEPVIALVDVPASLIERSRNVFDPSTSTWRAVRYLACRVNTTALIREGDQIRDRNTGVIYPVSSRKLVPRGLSGQSTLSLELQITTAP